MIRPDPNLSGDLKIRLEHFELKPLSSKDIPDLLAEFSDPRVVEWMDIDPLRTADEAASIVTWAEAQRSLGAGVRWSIQRRADGGFVGTCGFNNIVVERGRRGEIAYDLDHRWQGQGVMAEVLPAVMDFGWRRLRLHRLEALVTPGNERSCRLLERHGFIREGLLAGYGFWKGRFWDQIVYGLTGERPDATL
jgi:ribosomal-protein-alanine N-acetyltransferase